ncbi:MAG TPA: hypothetical protein VEF76_00415 [Patescibacteria group bacterium]|nr:hypothetical protein [Patescibacteria group bacterium]
MDKPALEKMLKMTDSDSETDAIMGLRGMQGGFRAEGVTLTEAVLFAFENLAVMKQRRPAITIEQAAPPPPAAAKPVTTTGMPNCRMPKPGCIELIAPGAASGTVIPLPPSAAEEAAHIADHLKDALVAAVINKSRFKLKVFDVKNNRGEVVETALQAEYDRDGMAVVRVWTNVKGEVANLAALLRKSVAQVYPDLYLT